MFMFIAGIVLTLTVQQLWRRWSWPKRPDTWQSALLWALRPRWWLALVLVPGLVLADDTRPACAEDAERERAAAIQRMEDELRAIIAINRDRFIAERADEIRRLYGDLKK